MQSEEEDLSIELNFEQFTSKIINSFPAIISTSRSTTESEEKKNFTTESTIDASSLKTVKFHTESTDVRFDLESLPKPSQLKSEKGTNDDLLSLIKTMIDSFSGKIGFHQYIR